MLASKAARGCMSSFTDTDPSPEQIKRNIDVMRKAADEVVVSENRGIRGGKKIERKKKKRCMEKRGGFIIISVPEISSR